MSKKVVPMIHVPDVQATIDWYRENRGWVERVKSGEYRLFYELNYAQRG